MEIANDRIAQGKDLRPIDKYYLEKEEEFKTIQNQIHVDDYRILFSSREFKITRVEYFVENKFSFEETITAS